MNRIYLNELFDYYQELLTLKEKDIFTDYYLEDLSLQEIADNLHISKSAVGKKVKIVENKLIEYENKLHLKAKKEQIKNLLDEKQVNKIIDFI